MHIFSFLPVGEFQVLYYDLANRHPDPALLLRSLPVGLRYISIAYNIKKK